MHRYGMAYTHHLLRFQRYAAQVFHFSKDCSLKAQKKASRRGNRLAAKLKSDTSTVRRPTLHPKENLDKKIVKAAPAIEVIQSMTPTVFTCPPLDPEIDYTAWAGKAQYLFSETKRDYVSPITLDYQLPIDGKPEFAFIGRSNVGKSSLVGALLGNTSIVRISREPGCTRNVNYFKFANKKGTAECYMIDLPGYGFAKASKTDREKWLETLKSFLKSRCFTILKRVFLLIDSRHPIKDTDLEMMDLLDKSMLSFQVILTKVDASTTFERKVCLETTFAEMMAKRHSCGLPIVHTVSARDGTGLEALKQSIAEMVYKKMDNFQLTSDEEIEARRIEEVEAAEEAIQIEKRKRRTR